MEYTNYKHNRGRNHSQIFSFNADTNKVTFTIHGQCIEFTINDPEPFNKATDINAFMSSIQKSAKKELARELEITFKTLVENI